MKYQLIGLTKDHEYERCIEALKRFHIPFRRTDTKIAPFNSREEAEAALNACREAAPEARIGIEEIPDPPTPE